MHAVKPGVFRGLKFAFRPNLFTFVLVEITKSYENVPDANQSVDSSRGSASGLAAPEVTDKAIQVGQGYAVFPLAGDEPALVVRCLDLVQRNWSRVGPGELRFSDGTTQPCFIKQYLDRTGDWQSDHWEYEQDGAIAASELLATVARVPRLIAQEQKLLLNIFEFAEVVSLDVLLRADQPAFDRCVEGAVRQMAEVLGAMQNPPATFDMAALPQKPRDFGTAQAVNFKGFEIRNAGVPPDLAGVSGPDDLVLFDFVRPYAAPIEEAAAKLFISIGLLNWGSPLGRFLRGPDKRLLAMAAGILEPWLDRRAIGAELELQKRFRTGEFKGTGGLEVVLKRLGVDLIGRKYLHQLASWCKANIN